MSLNYSTSNTSTQTQFVLSLNCQCLKDNTWFVLTFMCFANLFVGVLDVCGCWFLFAVHCFIVYDCCIIWFLIFYPTSRRGSRPPAREQTEKSLQADYISQKSQILLKIYLLEVYLRRAHGRIIYHNSGMVCSCPFYLFIFIPALFLIIPPHRLGAIVPRLSSFHSRIFQGLSLWPHNYDWSISTGRVNQFFPTPIDQFAIQLTIIK